MSSLPTVSIGLPVFNGARYLRAAIDDFLEQTFQDFELIICDNASTDETEAIARDAVGRDERVRYFRNPTNMGALPNSNRTIFLARGKYFCLAAHDDRHAPAFLERLVSVLEKQPSVVLAYTRCELIDEVGAPLRALPESGVHVTPNGRAVGYDQKLERTLPDDAVSRYHAVLRSNDVNSPIHGLIRRKVLERIGGHQFNGSDRLIVAHAGLLGSFAYVPEPLFSFRVHPESTFFLSRAEWAERETGETNRTSPLETFRTFGRYVSAVRNSSLSGTDRACAYLTTITYLARPTALRNAFLPGLDNYFGWKRWPWQRAEKTTSQLSNLPSRTSA